MGVATYKLAKATGGIGHYAEVTVTADFADFRVARLDAVVRFELIAWRLKHPVHLRDLIEVGLIDSTWPAHFPSPLGERLQQLLDDPNG
jgi:hypothetical protein